MIVKGVSLDRSRNDCNFDYLKVRGHEEGGMLFYMHKYFAGYMHYYERLGFQKHLERILELEQILEAKDAKRAEMQSKAEQRELNEKERLELELPDEELIELVKLQREVREVTYKMRKKMNDLTLRMHLRTTICFKDIGIFSAGKKGSQVYGDKYSGNHIAIFECDMKQPPQMSFVDHTYHEVLKAYRINPNKWKIVDIDNFMQGNSYFEQVEEEAVWNAKVKDLMKHEPGKQLPIYEEKQFHENPHYMKDVLIPMIEKKVSRREFLDTNANSLLSPLHQKREEILAKLRSAEAAPEKKSKKKEKKATASEAEAQQ